MKVIVLLLVLYFVFECALFGYKYFNLPVLTKIEQADKILGSGPRLKYIAAGDSAGLGYGASSVEKSYSYKVAEFLSQTNTVEYKNISVIGHKTQDVLEKQVEEIISFHPNVITISMGGNDATHLVSEKEILENYKQIINRLENETDAQIYITDIANFNGASVLPWFYVRLLEYRSKNINKRLMELENSRVKIADIHNFGWDEEQYKPRSKTYAGDHFHPNDLGYQNWANAFLSKLNVVK